MIKLERVTAPNHKVNFLYWALANVDRECRERVYGTDRRGSLRHNLYDRLGSFQGLMEYECEDKWTYALVKEKLV